MEGNIGSGKSSVLEGLEGKEVRGRMVHVLKEPIEDWLEVDGVNLLGAFYGNSKRWGYMFQKHVLETMYEREKKCLRLVNEGCVVVSERSMESSRYVFSNDLAEKRLINKGEFASICEMYAEMRAKLQRRTTAIIYLNTPSGVSFERMEMRNRMEEVGVEKKLLECLEERYWRYLEMEERDATVEVWRVDGGKGKEEVLEKVKGE